MKESAHGRDGTKDASENRRIILEYIRNNPGTYLRKIAKDLELALGDTQYHINILQREGLTRSLKPGLYRHYYSIDISNEHHQAMLALLMNDTARDILIHLVQHPGSRQRDIAKFKQMSSPTINWHMSRMMSLSIVVGVRDGKIVRYFIRDVGSFIHVLTNYYPDIWRNLAPRLVEMFVKISSKEEHVPRSNWN